MLHDTNFWRTVALAVLTFGQAAFVIMYVVFPWWRNILGRVLFGESMAMLLILVFALSSRWFDFGGNDGVFVTLYMFLAAMIWAKVFAFVGVRNRDHRERGSAFPETEA